MYASVVSAMHVIVPLLTVRVSPLINYHWTVLINYKVPRHVEYSTETRRGNADLADYSMGYAEQSNELAGENV